MKNTQKFHYPFCSELKNNVSLMCPDSQKRSNFSVSFPKLALFKVNTNFASNFWNSFSGPNFKDFQGINFIDDLAIEKVEKNNFNDIMQGAYFAFIAPHDFLTAEEKKEKTRCYYYDQIKGQITFAENEGSKWFKEQSHLVEHSTFQLFFLDGMLGTYNLGKMDYEIQEGKIIINYVLVVKATPSGTLFKFNSGEISPPIRWELAVKGNVITMKVFQEIFKGGEGFWKKIKSPLLRTTGGVVGGMVGGPAGAAAGSAAGGAIAGDGKDDKKSDSVEQNKGIEEALGLVNVKSSKATEEQQTKRWLEAVGRTDENISDPTLYYTNDIGFSYNFFDFWMRLNEWDRILTSRLVFSSDLYNNLKHNNNENPITYPLNITFQKLGNILRKGYWQGKLMLAHDPGGNMTKAFARGVYFYEDLEKDFPNPDLGFSQQHSTSLYSLGGVGDTYTAQVITEPKITDIPFDYRPEAKGYGHETYLTIDNENVRNSSWKGLGWEHWDKDKGWCWGCTQEKFSPDGYKGSAHDPNSPACPPFADKMVGKFTPSQNCNFEGKFHVDGSNTHYEPLKAGIEYEIWVNHTKLWFRYLETKTVLQKLPGHDEFLGMDWTPPAGSGGDTDIPFTDPDVGVDPNKDPDGPMPEPDFVPEVDPGVPGEPEITPLEPDIVPDTTQDYDNTQDIDPPPVEVDPPFDTDPPKDKDHDTSRDPDPGDEPPEKPEDFDK